ncbi:MAG: hypothetical protein GXY51_12545 [Bacteroidetes bacterium]|nr:hypothetical protein [Bacteroidota bacterium]
MAKKILILAGTHFQIPVIEYSKRMGHHVITCDNRPSNPGHQFADEYYNVSTTDIKGVVDLAIAKNIDAVLVYGSDPAAITAACVSEQLNLPGNSYESVSVLSDKGLFRKFLKDNGFPAPVYGVFKSYNKAYAFFSDTGKTCFVKPVDSSGSKGISKLNPGDVLKPALDYAMQFSRKREIIIEEKIERKGPHIHGEAFVLNGELIFLMLGDQYFSQVTVTAPMSTTVPSIFHADIMQDITNELIKIIKLIGYSSGGLNIEIIRGQNNKIYFNEIGARNGGNFMPDLVSMATGFKMVAANVNAVLGEPVDIKYKYPEQNYYTQLILHSHDNGVYNGNNLPYEFNTNLIFRKEYFNIGDYVHTYKDSRHVIGVYLYEFQQKGKCLDFINYIQMNKIIKLGMSDDKF